MLLLHTVDHLLANYAINFTWEFVALRPFCNPQAFLFIYLFLFFGEKRLISLLVVKSWSGVT